MYNNHEEINNQTFSMNTGKHVSDADKTLLGKTQHNDRHDDAQSHLKEDTGLASHITIVPFSTTKTGSFQ